MKPSRDRTEADAERLRRRASSLLTLVLTWMGCSWLGAVGEAPYAVAPQPWADGLGNHRAVLRVEQKADAVVARIPWRRRDRDPERKDIIVMDAASGSRVTNVLRFSDDRFEGVLAFQPPTVPGDYFVYYLPYPPQKGWGSYTLDYFKPQDKADPAWKAKVAPESASALSALPSAKVLRLEARTEFDSFYPMEVVATLEEVRAMLDKAALAQPYLLFPEDRRFPIRMKDELPLRWVKSGPTNVFRGEAQRNEFYVFQIGVWAARTNLAGLDVEFSGEIAKWLRCFNTGGTNWDGQPFHKTLAVPQGRVQALWLGVDVPPDAKPGEHTATVTVRPTNAPPSSIELILTVLPTELADRGDRDLWRLARLRWLDSMLGGAVAQLPSVDWSQEREWKAGVKLLETNMLWVTASGALTIDGQVILEQPPVFIIQPHLDVPLRCIGAGSFDLTNDLVYVEEIHVAQQLIAHCSRLLDSSTEAVRLSLKANERFAIGDMSLKFIVTTESARYFMGLGQRAGPTPTNFTWHWTGPYNSFWIGNAQAGLHVKLLGSSYEGPMQNLYHPKPPPNWFNDGKGGVRISYQPPANANSEGGAAPRTADALPLTPALSMYGLI